MDYLIQFIARILTWLLGFVEWFAQWCWQTLLGALIAVLQLIPVPSWVQSAPALLSAIPPGVVWFCSAFALPQGFSIIIGAYVIRFIIRRIPLVG